MRTQHWSRAAPRGDPAGVLMALRPPVEWLLSSALRRVAQRRPEVFERLGAFGDAAFLIAPDGSPVAFRLAPEGAAAGVQVRRRDDRSPCAARIEGPLGALLGLFDGSQDADAAFFSRAIRVSGDIEAVMALHNTLEAADLTLADLLGLSAPAGDVANAALRFVRQTAAAKAAWA
ncbi:SCP2 domain-containing protein [Phenylobacterium sp.]|uniref:ubiquinone anaerobic biosynthesis accessory factor UbiT n=1 Tax=Phenylobacterium sp. TaxID=1871053 RepID=UPI002720ED75|nr:SCP2 sterol-binding domain-containing protein [Phenylobacterium sp.]MDO8802340.1 SCP2 sterol-binding domain-containing protein [Phenylobacterium sp.]